MISVTVENTKKICHSNKSNEINGMENSLSPNPTLSVDLFLIPTPSIHTAADATNVYTNACSLRKRNQKVSRTRDHLVTHSVCKQNGGSSRHASRLTSRATYCFGHVTLSPLDGMAEAEGVAKRSSDRPFFSFFFFRLAIPIGVAEGYPSISLRPH